ncbi:MAG: FAD-dependent oxidoreductase [Leptospiraceae bacterium]|nr:FAD-dependent oxidoreductase [Leptospiraceae bacterium]MCK6382341.1 FAD-dependent oxidoreductase [Leptospiraceae bacterium]NUM40362.1 FAD-dependent oxidoreductase [Leptospiraceae bacterium]
MKMNRLNFLKNSSIAILALTTKKVHSEDNSIFNTSAKKKETITIIGGGLSGLYSAYILGKAGIKTTLIEGGERYGGRILSYREGSDFIGELGGEWITTDQKNMLGLVKELDLKAVAHNVQKEIVYSKENRPSELSQQTKQALKKIFGMYRGMSVKQKHGLDKIDIYNYLKYQDIANDDLNFIEMKYRMKYGESIRSVSANGFFSDFSNLEFHPKTVFRIDGGNDNIIEKLLSNLHDSEKILNDPVTEVDQRNGKVKVKTKSGKVIESDTCIVTVPPALVSKIKWTPDLPREKKLASVLIKNSRAAKLLVLTKGREFGEGEIHFMNAPLQKVYFSEINSKEINLLNGLSIGDASELFYEGKQSYLKELVAISMKRYSLEEIFEIEKVISKVWQSEPLINGAFTIFPSGSLDAKESLRSPFNRVFFAGEALADENGSMNSCIVSAIGAVNML